MLVGMSKQKQAVATLPSEIQVDLSLQSSTRLDGAVRYRCGCRVAAGLVLDMCQWHTRLVAKHEEAGEGT